MDTWHTHKQTHTPLTIKIIGTDDDDDVGTRGLMTQRASFEIWIVDIRLCQDFFYPLLDTLSILYPRTKKELEDYRSLPFSGLGDDYRHRQFLEDIPG